MAILPLFLIPPTEASGQSGASEVTPSHGASVAPVSEPSLEGSGEQLRVLASVYAAWSKGARPKGGGDSRDIASYNFRIAASDVNYTVSLWPKKPVVTRIPKPQGTRMESESSTFFFTARRNNFKVTGVGANM